MVVGLVNSQGGDGFASSDLGQPFGLLGVRSAQDQGRGTGQRRGQQRRGGQGAAGLFQDQAQAQITEFRSTEFFRHDHAGPAHLAHLGPQRRIIAQRRLGIADLAQGRDRRLFRGPFAGCVAQHGLFFGQHGHGLLLEFGHF